MHLILLLTDAPFVFPVGICSPIIPTQQRKFKSVLLTLQLATQHSHTLHSVSRCNRYVMGSPPVSCRCGYLVPQPCGTLLMRPPLAVLRHTMHVRSQKPPG